MYVCVLFVVSVGSVVEEEDDEEGEEALVSPSGIFSHLKHPRR